MKKKKIPTNKSPRQDVLIVQQEMNGKMMWHVCIYVCVCVCVCVYTYAVLSHSVLHNPMDYSPPGSSVHGDSPDKNTEAGCHALLQGIFPPKDRTQFPTLQADSFPSEPPGKPP